MYFILVFILQMTLSEFESQHIVIKNISDITNFSNKRFEKKSLKLILNEIDFDSEASTLFKKSKNIKLIHEIEFKNIEYSQDALNSFLNVLSYHNIKKISFKNMSLNSKIMLLIFARTLEEFEIINCDDVTETLQSLDFNIVKRLKTLTISSVPIPQKVWTEMFAKWTKSENFLKLKHIDFSNTNMSMDALNVLPFEKESALEVLKLNDIMLKIENIIKPKDLSEGKESFYIKTYKPIKFNSIYFKKLKHFEMINAFYVKKSPDKKVELINEFYENEDFYKLEYFRGPRLFNNYNKENFSQLLSLPFKSKIVPIDINDTEMISGLMKSETLSNYEEITFYGEALKVDYIKLILPKMTNLKNVNLIRLNTNEFEIKSLIESFPSIEFFIQSNFRKGPQIFPKWADEDDDISYYEN